MGITEDEPCNCSACSPERTFRLPNSTEKRSPTNALSTGDGIEILGRTKSLKYRAPEIGGLWSARALTIHRESSLIIQPSTDQHRCMAQLPEGRKGAICKDWRGQRAQCCVLREVGALPVPSRHIGKLDSWDKGWVLRKAAPRRSGIISPRQSTASDFLNEVLICNIWQNQSFVKNLTA